MRRGSWILLAGLAVAGGACAHAGAGATHAAPAPAAAAVHQDTTSVRVNVVNNYSTAMEIYAAGTTTTHHLGTVAPGIPREFVLQRQLFVAGDLVRFIAQATGFGPRVQSDALQVAPGDIVDFEIATELIGSRATVRP